MIYLSALLPFRLEDATAEVLKRLHAMQFQIQGIFDRLDYGKLPREGNEIKDVRGATLMIWKADIGVNIMLLNFVSSPVTGKLSLKQFNEIAGTDNRNVPPAFYSMKAIEYLRLALATMFQFRTEILITNILDHFDRQKARLGYLSKVESLFGILAQEDKIISADWRRDLEVLTVLQFIRNSLHNNGYHNNKNFSTMLCGLPYRFVKGEEVKCAGWEHVIIALEESLTVLEKILNSVKVEAIPSGIPTYYVDRN